MTRDEALKKMQAVKSYMTSGNPIWSVTEMGEAFDMAIEALEQPERKTGKWRTVTKKSNLFDAYSCSECNGLVYGKTNFCPYCGCEMER